MGSERQAALNEPLLIDECLSPQLVAIANLRGLRATHVIYRDRQGQSDHTLMSLIREEGLILVTSNRRDFLALYKREPVHPGLIIIVPGSLKETDQIRYFSFAMDAIEGLPDLINTLVEVQNDGSVTMTEWPPSR